MTGIGAGCHELRIIDATRTWRIMYSIQPDAIVILEVFAKTTRATPVEISRICRKRVGQYRAAAQEKEQKR